METNLGYRWRALRARESGGGGGAAGDIYAYNSAERVGSTPLFAALISARPLSRQPLSSTCCHTSCTVFVSLFQPIMKPWRMQAWDVSASAAALGLSSQS